MYLIEEESFGKFTKIKLSNRKTKEYVSIIPDFGGTISELHLQKNNKLYSIVDGYNYADELEAEMEKSYKGAKLVPYPNRVAFGKYSFNNINYQLPINHEMHSIHGLVYDKKLSLVNQQATEEDVSIELQYIYDKEYKGYPFSFKLNIFYTFSEEGLTLSTRIENIDKNEIPVADGWHLYFKVANKIDECLFKIPSSETLALDETLIPTGKINKQEKYIHFSKIEGDNFDTCFVLPGKKSILSAELYDIIEDIRVVAWQESGNKKYNYMQVYSPPNRETLAIEPMTCEPNALNSGKGLIVLKPGEVFDATCGVKLN